MESAARKRITIALRMKRVSATQPKGSINPKDRLTPLSVAEMPSIAQHQQQMMNRKDTWQTMLI
jgi:hypothetical protein